MRMTEWRALELTDMAEWPRIAQGGALVAGFLLMQLLGYQFYLSPKLTTLHQLRQQESELSEYLERTALQVAPLPAQQRQLRQAQQAFDAQLRALPAEQELASLLAAVNQAGVQHQLTMGEVHPFRVARRAGGIEGGRHRVLVEILELIGRSGGGEQGFVLADQVWQIGGLVGCVGEQQGLFDGGQFAGETVVEGHELAVDQHELVFGVVHGEQDLVR